MREAFPEEQITAIDLGDKRRSWPVGKVEAHQKNIPHTAISIFIFCEQSLLLQQRADGKYHSAGLWGNSVCSHPRWQESAVDCANRRLQEELGFHTPLVEFGELEYQARVGLLYENEHVHLFAGMVQRGEVDVEQRFNIDEVAAVRWVALSRISQEIEQSPQLYSEWFKIYMGQYQRLIEQQHRSLVLERGR